MAVALLPPKMDFVFKRIFGNENHPNVLISFLNAVLNPVDPIKSVILKDTTIEKSHLEDKYSRLDVKAMTNKGEHINIEIQLKDEYNMIKRSLYYWSKLYEGQLENGENYQKLSRTICINLLDFNLLNHDKFHSVYRLKDCETNEELTDVMELHFIELKKMKDVQRVEEVKTKLEAWLYFINQPDSELVQELEKVEIEIKEAKAELIRLSGDRKERERYEKRRESRLNEISALSYAEEKGAKKEKIEIAKNLLDVLDDETISLKTGLSIEEVKEIRKEQN
ncbi:Rpn family recombination-promoting nuclease/putative transposase [Turicibacter sanguinis]|nr:Rpn family recombination-promoting nuclease/putative transposase [Turicibacter sanguinis]MDB8576111.1 Rpn family recombination-promoting nuclease/putative transposase [Turicibacter sanguinis]MDB8578916.1 Rpn family recombination-promoting nuclease/putative transposase [Turicibacter sanguinis]MDB8584729.1 Rpn family recombination-promoting nuclease/putative transposase [Turicibacter sanguinis]MDB8587676.1 Rpn family recombination-promoting nuclease/putative transposase [Turicibacter sanguinis